jgi:hypothetical protein
MAIQPPKLPVELALMAVRAQTQRLTKMSTTFAVSETF